MDCKYISFEDAGVFSHNDTSYASLHPDLASFYAFRPELDAFPSIIENRIKSKANRNLLCEVLEDQYKSLDHHEAVADNIQSLKKEHTFTITTAHQPSLFTGPLYYIYKIVSAINLSQKLNNTYTDYHFVPVFWLGGEDHDFEEINHVKIFRETLVWDNDESGSVGQMSIEKITPLIEQLKGILGDSESSKQIISYLMKAHENNDTYGKFMIELTHLLFKDKGLVIIDPSDKRLKQASIELFKKEILGRKSESLVKIAQEQLEKKGFKPQAFPRPINLFYTEKGFRERIDFVDGKYEVLNRNISFSEEEIITDLAANPERYSPNVIMRPLYQEWILPNLAYIGGGGELAYWLERKEQFEYFGVPYPMLIRRDSVLWIDANSAKKMKKLGLNEETIWNDVDLLIKKHVKKNINEENNILNEKNSIQDYYQQLIRKIEGFEPTLRKAAQGEMAKAIKGLENLENKIIKAEKKNQETTVSQIRAVKDKLFPSNSLQERKDNFIPIYVKHGQEFLDALYENLDPLDRRVKIIYE
ncbi:MAG: bacillithiol biosynthesis cysteine-adding enzyme BshC [Maribacter sp.]|jgi:bacillithiol biosynthesis cysteine-adding enzyme BshC